MHAIEPCGTPYDHNGDVQECRLPYGHDSDCPAANRAADLDARIEQATRWNGWPV